MSISSLHSDGPARPLHSTRHTSLATHMHRHLATTSWKCWLEPAPPANPPPASARSPQMRQRTCASRSATASRKCSLERKMASFCCPTRPLGTELHAEQSSGASNAAQAVVMATGWQHQKRTHEQRQQ